MGDFSFYMRLPSHLAETLLNGEDLNTRPDQSPSRWVINFYDWSLEKAETYHDCMKFVLEKVKPERQRKNEKGEYVLRKPLPEKWWIYGDKRPALYATIAGMKQVLVVCQTGKYHSFIFVPPDMIFDQKLVIFAVDDYGFFAQLQSSFHTNWALSFGSTLSVSPVYTPSDCFETFPFTNNPLGLENIGNHYYQHRQSIMLFRQEGLTKTYNRFHDPQEIAEDIMRLRELHCEMDEAMAKAYRWDDLELKHSFYQTRRGIRYTISDEAWQKVLDRLLRLNHERYAEEVAMGLHEKGAKRGKGKRNTGKGNDMGKRQGRVGEQGELVFE